MTQDVTGREFGEGLLTTFFLAALAVAWMLVLVPAILRARSQSPFSSTERFRRRMDMIAPRHTRSGRMIVVLDSPHRRAATEFGRARREIRRRRRRARFLKLLVACAVISAGVAAWRGEGFWEFNFGIDAVLVLYVGILLERKARKRERTTKVRRLHKEAGPELYEPVAADATRRA